MTVSDFKDWGQVLAWFSAAGFFAYKVLTGYLITDLSLKLSCERRRSSDAKDYLAVILALKKGERGGVELHDVKVRVQPHPTFDGQPQVPANAVRPAGTQKMISINRLDRSSAQPWATVIWDEIGHLTLPPGDEMQVAALFEVDRQYAYVVETVVLARKILCLTTKLGQWRATSISLPGPASASPLNV